MTASIWAYSFREKWTKADGKKQTWKWWMKEGGDQVIPGPLRGTPICSAKFTWEVSAKYAGTLQKKGFPNLYRFYWEPDVHGSFCQIYGWLNVCSSFYHQPIFLFSNLLTDQRLLPTSLFLFTSLGFYICACPRCPKLSNLLSLPHSWAKRTSDGGSWGLPWRESFKGSRSSSSVCTCLS